MVGNVARPEPVWRAATKGGELSGVPDLSVIPLERGVEKDAHFSESLAASEAVFFEAIETYSLWLAAPSCIVNQTWKDGACQGERIGLGGG
jgi:hypothetical protein